MMPFNPENQIDIDGAVEALKSPKPAEEPEAEAPEPEIEDNEPEREEDAAEADEDSSEPTDDEGDGAEEPTEADAEEEDEAEQPPIDPPHSWDAEAKAAFAELPRNLQEKIAEREKQREGAVSKAQQEAAEARKQAEQARAESQNIGQIAERANTVFRDRWDGIDWRKWQQENPQQAQAAWTQYQMEREQLEQVNSAHQRAEQQSRMEHLREEQAKLVEKVPELADPQKGPQLKAQIAQFLIDEGFSPERIAAITANEVALAYRAMKREEAKKSFSEKPKPKQAPKPQKTVKPSAAASVSPTKQRLKDVQQRLSKTGKVDDAVALLQARRTA